MNKVIYNTNTLFVMAYVKPDQNADQMLKWYTNASVAVLNQDIPTAASVKKYKINVTTGLLEE